MFVYCALALTLGTACGPSPAGFTPDTRTSDVLIVWNANAPENKRIVDAYSEFRGIPEKNILAVRVPVVEQIDGNTYAEKILIPVREAIAKRQLKINYIVTIRGMPLRMDSESGHSLDSWLMVDANPAHFKPQLAQMDMPRMENGRIIVNQDELRRTMSPYFGKKDHFDSAKYGIYLATRLDGYTVEDALSLVNSAKKAKRETGTFLLDAAPDKAAFGNFQGLMAAAAKALTAKGLTVQFDETQDFIGDKSGLMGYASWGSNDSRFSGTAYRSLRFKPGAIAETFVSTSARTMKPTNEGQSLIADLIRQGLAGVKGYVSEPFVFSLTRVDILFDRYTSGYNLAESYYMATPLLKWKDVVLGDPLAAPYEK